MTFEELSALIGTPLREVQFDVPRADLECLREIPAFKDYDPVRETLYMIKPIYGLKDAPRAWRKKFHEVLKQWMSCRQLYSEPELYCVHEQVKEEPTDHQLINKSDRAIHGATRHWQRHYCGACRVKPYVTSSLGAL